MPILGRLWESFKNYKITPVHIFSFTGLSQLLDSHNHDHANHSAKLRSAYVEASTALASCLQYVNAREPLTYSWYLCMKPSLFALSIAFLILYFLAHVFILSCTLESLYFPRSVRSFHAGFFSFFPFISTIVFSVLLLNVTRIAHTANSEWWQGPHHSLLARSHFTWFILLLLAQYGFPALLL